MKNHYYEIQFLLHIIYSNGHSGATHGGLKYEQSEVRIFYFMQKKMYFCECVNYFLKNCLIVVCLQPVLMVC